jgi:hypothetical protein
LSNRFNWNEWSVFHRRNSPIMTSMQCRMSDLLKRGCDPPYISKEVYAPFRAYLKRVYARARDESHGFALPQAAEMRDSAGGLRWVTCGLCAEVHGATGVPGIAADLLHRQIPAAPGHFRTHAS